MNQTAAVTQFDRLRWKDGKLHAASPDPVVTEEPLEIRLRGQSIAITMRTPGHDDELTAGFLFSENILRHRTDLVEVAHCYDTPAESRGNIINVFISPKCPFESSQLERHFFTSSSCGVCGRAAIEQIQSNHPPLQEDEKKFPASILNQLQDQLRRAQNTFEKTGGAHAAALFDTAGNLMVSREDVGRHNAVDKVLGHAFLNELPTTNSILLVSGRVSFEITQKALAGRIPLIAAISAPSSLAVQCADENNQTLVAFLRENSMNIYTGGQRIT